MQVGAGYIENDSKTYQLEFDTVASFSLFTMFTLIVINPFSINLDMPDLEYLIINHQIWLSYVLFKLT